MKKYIYAIYAITLCFFSSAYADIVVSASGKAATNCIVCDRGVNFWLWNSMDDVRKMPKVVPASKIKDFKIDRTDPAWDIQPKKPDLSVTHVSRYPRLPSLHGNIDYAPDGSPTIGHHAKALKDIGNEKNTHPEKAVEGIQFNYTPGQIVTLTAHVRNVGFSPASPFTYTWKLNGKVEKTGRYTTALREREEATFAFSFLWHEFPELEFSVQNNDDEIVIWNNTLKDYLWGFSFVYILSEGRADVWHTVRNAVGSFSFEDFYRWHIDIMNDLMEASVFPATPSGMIARVRLDDIIITDDVKAANAARHHANGLSYDQGGWVWEDVEKPHVPVAYQEKGKGWVPPSVEWRNRTEWSMPHELGHQLGLIDWYNYDYPGSDAHLAPDNGEKIAHLMDYPHTMMHWNGPHIFSEVDAGYLNYTRNIPRGYFGDHVFAIPTTNILRVVDINGLPLRNATVEIFQRGVKIDTNAEPQTIDGSLVYSIIEDGDFSPGISADPVAVGTTDNAGELMLPNRPAVEVRTLSGFTRKNNPLGNVNVVGGRGLLLIKVTKKEHEAAYFWLDNYNFNVSWFRGYKDSYTYVLPTVFGSEDGPHQPQNVTVEKCEGKNAKISWTAPSQKEINYLDTVIGYRVYRRVGNSGLNDIPWHPVATLMPNETTATVDISQQLVESYMGAKTERLGVTALGENGRESALVYGIVK
jgi:hypothetical protein